MPPSVKNALAGLGLEEPARVVPPSPRTPIELAATPAATKKVKRFVKVIRKEGRHYLEKDPWYDSEDRNQRRCSQCDYRTVYICKTCRIPFCVVPCFEEYHEAD